VTGTDYFLLFFLFFSFCRQVDDDLDRRETEVLVRRFASKADRESMSTESCDREKQSRFRRRRFAADDEENSGGREMRESSSGSGIVEGVIIAGGKKLGASGGKRSSTLGRAGAGGNDSLMVCVSEDELEILETTVDQSEILRRQERLQKRSFLLEVC
jgi:hypothetical protein